LLRGASGSGKPTLLALLAGLLRLQQGRLTVAGTELAGLGARWTPGAAPRWVCRSACT
jgi:putative ABC transport system ATP-binding protein